MQKLFKTIGADPNKIKQRKSLMRYIEMARKYHPDINKSPNAAKK